MTTKRPKPPPFPSYAFPKPYDPNAIQRQAATAANRAVQSQIGALPTVEQQSAPFQQQIASEQGLGQALLDEMRGAQTYRVNLATGLPEAFKTDAAATGGDANTAQRAASTLASYGTSAANQIAQQEAVAPASTAANTRIIQQRLTDLLTGPQGHDALARQIQAQEPQLENSYTTAYGQQAQIPFNEALQLATANENYDLAQQTYGLNVTNANNQRNQQNNQYNLQIQSLKLKQLGLQLQASRDANSYKTALLKLQQQSKNSQNTADARAATQAQQAITQARTQIIQQANTLYKRTSSTGGSPGSFEVHYFTPSGSGASATLTPHTETFASQAAADARYSQLVSQSGQGIVRNVSRSSNPGTGGTAGQSVRYLQDQAVSYGVNLLLQSAPWLPRGAATRMVQQLVNPIFGRGVEPQAPPIHPGANP